MRSSLKVVGLGVLGLAFALGMAGKAAAMDPAPIMFKVTHVKAKAADGSIIDVIDLQRSRKLVKVLVTLPMGDFRVIPSRLLIVNQHLPDAASSKLSSKAKARFSPSVVTDNGDGTGTLVIRVTVIDPTTGGISAFSHTVTMPLINGL